MPTKLEPARTTTDGARASGGTWVNDRHSGLNRTRVRRVARPANLLALVAEVADASRRDLAVSVCGNRHAMGGQQFGEDAVTIDMRGLNRVVAFDVVRGVVEVQAGMTWTQLLAFLDRSRGRHGAAAGANGWAIVQKQTGADELTIGGAVAANIHGRGLTMAPFIENIEALTVVAADGRVVTCSREENAALFRHVVGGYGLFGVVYSVRLRLAPRRKVRRMVEIVDAEALMGRFDERIAAGCEFGDFQFDIDHRSPDFLRRGVFSCYRPVADEVPMPAGVPKLGKGAWLELLYLAHVDKSRGFRLYAEHYQRTDGAVYWSDAHQFSTYVDGYHDVLDRRMGSACGGSEMITELYVPRGRLTAFLAAAAIDLRRSGASVIYGTVRLIERDTESALPWAREAWACVVFNICVEHSGVGLRKARRIFQKLIDRAIEQGGSYYLTYHRFARRDQVEACHPQMREFLRAKRRVDPDRRFQSDWWRHHENLLGR